jgi:hypothetical protein
MVRSDEKKRQIRTDGCLHGIDKMITTV